MTWIIDDQGKRWVAIAKRKRRKACPPKRFKDINVGDQLMCSSVFPGYGADGEFHDTKVTEHWVVTDIWFDPVAGQDDKWKGHMVAIQQIGADGELHSWKRAHTMRGLASNGYQYANIDYIAHCKARAGGLESGKVLGIGMGRAIRKRPKIAGI
jgi:hypothetical protein